MPGRADVQRSDHEAVLGDCVRISGLSAFVNSGSVVDQEFLDELGIVIDVTILNRDDSSKSFSSFDWRLQTPQGQVVNSTVLFGDFGTRLDFGSDLVPGGSVTGIVEFDYSGPGTYYVIWKPNAFDADRGIWAIEVP